MLNHGPRNPTVVMGISGKEHELLNEANVQRCARVACACACTSSVRCVLDVLSIGV